MRAIVNTYGGWYAGSAYFGEEMVAPRTQCSPRRPSAVMLLVTALYVAVNAALLHVLTPARDGGVRAARGRRGGAGVRPSGSGR